jgi:hypothetical protein
MWRPCGADLRSFLPSDSAQTKFFPNVWLIAQVAHQNSSSAHLSLPGGAVRRPNIEYSGLEVQPEVRSEANATIYGLLMLKWQSVYWMTDEHWVSGDIGREEKNVYLTGVPELPAVGEGSEEAALADEPVLLYLIISLCNASQINCELLTRNPGLKSSHHSIQ